MLMIFYRKVINDTKVMARVVALVDGRGMEVGELKFPTKQVWSKFIGAVQRGALEIPDLEVRMENSMEDDGYDHDPITGDQTTIAPVRNVRIDPPQRPLSMTELEKKAAEIHKQTVATASEAAAIPAQATTLVSRNEPKVVIQGAPKPNE